MGAFALLATEVERLGAAGPPADVKQFIHLHRLMLSFNRLLVDIGIAEIRSASQPAEMTGANVGMPPFPPKRRVPK